MASRTPFGILQKIVIPVAQHPVASVREPLAACGIFCIVRMLAAINFDNDLLFVTNEIGDEGANRDLPPEFDALQLPRSQQPRKLFLGVSRNVTHRFCVTQAMPWDQSMV